MQIRMMKKKNIFFDILQFVNKFEVSRRFLIIIIGIRDSKKIV